MKGIIVTSKFLVPPTAAAWVLWPFIIFKKEEYKTPERINHERIHIRQCNETLVVGFYVIYIINFVVNLILMNRKPYRSILFEREAFENEDFVAYLEDRKFWAWTKYFNQKKTK